MCCFRRRDEATYVSAERITFRTNYCVHASTWQRNELFGGHQHTFCHSTLVWTDVLRILIRLDINLSERIHDRRIHNDSEPYRNPSSYSNNGQQVIADTGFQGHDNHIFFLLKRNKWYNFEFRCCMNREIRKPRIRNKWSVEQISNRFWLFLGKSPHVALWSKTCSRSCLTSPGC